VPTVSRRPRQWLSPVAGIADNTKHFETCKKQSSLLLDILFVITSTSTSDEDTGLQIMRDDSCGREDPSVRGVFGVRGPLPGGTCPLTTSP
jgi:hypothetical protein